MVGAGARIGELNERLAEHGLALPVGTCPSVGIAGLTLAAESACWDVSTD